MLKFPLAYLDAMSLSTNSSIIGIYLIRSLALSSVIMSYLRTQIEFFSISGCQLYWLRVTKKLFSKFLPEDVRN